LDETWDVRDGIEPFDSASVTIARATRSFELPPSERNSAFPRILHPVALDSDSMRMMGVCPIRSRGDEYFFFSFLLEVVGFGACIEFLLVQRKYAVDMAATIIDTDEALMERIWTRCQKKIDTRAFYCAPSSKNFF
jgi:hypothetical protein